MKKLVQATLAIAVIGGFAIFTGCSSNECSGKSSTECSKCSKCKGPCKCPK